MPHARVVAGTRDLPAGDVVDAVRRRVHGCPRLGLVLDASLPAIGGPDLGLVRARDESFLDQSGHEVTHVIGRPGDDDLDDSMGRSSHRTTQPTRSMTNQPTARRATIHQPSRHRRASTQSGGETGTGSSAPQASPMSPR